MGVDTSDRKETFPMNGSTVDFDFSFRALTSAPTDIKCVIVEIATGEETALEYTTDYSVIINSDGVGGVVTVVDAESDEYNLVVYRETTNLQETSYSDYNQFPASTLEEDLDRRTLIEQEMQEDLDRALKLPISSTGSNIALPSPSADKVLGWDATGTALENKDGMDEAIAACEAAQIAAEAAQATAEGAEVGAVTAQTLAELARVAAVTAQTLAEAAAASIPDKASQAEAEAGTVDTKYMTPLKTSQAITALGGGMQYTDTRFAIGYFSRDMAVTSSTQAITGLGFAPKAVMFFAVTDGAKVASWGLGKNATSGSVCIFNNDIASADTFSLYSSSGAIMHVVSAGNYYVGKLSALGADGFSIAWSRVGTPTGTLTVVYLALR